MERERDRDRERERERERERDRGRERERESEEKQNHKIRSVILAEGWGGVGAYGFGAKGQESQENWFGVSSGVSSSTRSLQVHEFYGSRVIQVG